MNFDLIEGILYGVALISFVLAMMYVIFESTL